ncbi:MAG: hypothetical protein AAGI46_14265 [Planctomycetota bacterium]
MSVAEAGIVCVSCGYDLRGQPVEGRCPECGQRVSASIPETLPALSPSELRVAHRGSLLLSISGLAAVAFVAGTFFLFLIPFWNERKSLPFPLRFSAMMCPIIVVCGVLGYRQLRRVVPRDVDPDSIDFGALVGWVVALGFTGHWAAMMWLARTRYRHEQDDIIWLSLVTFFAISLAPVWTLGVDRMLRVMVLRTTGVSAPRPSNWQLLHEATRGIPCLVMIIFLMLLVLELADHAFSVGGSLLEGLATIGLPSALLTWLGLMLLHSVRALDARYATVFRIDGDRQ